MDWMDYREKLGIGFNDDEKFQSVKNHTLNHFSHISNSYDEDSHFEFCTKVGEKMNYKNDTPLAHIWQILEITSTLKEFLAYYIAFINTYNEDQNKKTRKDLYEVLEKGLNQFKISFELLQENGQYFVFPKGAEELDRALVSEPLQWLSKYPSAHKTFCIALKQYSDGTYSRDVADNFRKALEEFLKEFFENEKNLDNNIKEVKDYLKAQNADSEIANILGMYNSLNNKSVKHHDKIDSKYLEFLMYQTGLFIRMLIVVKTEEEQANGN